MKPDKDQFEEWLAHPVTEYVHKALDKFAEEARALWLARSWDGGKADLVELNDLRGRASVAMDLKSWTLEDIEELLDDKPERDSSHGVQGTGAAKGS